MKTMKLLICLIFIFSYLNDCWTQECPQPTVQKRTIIRSATSIQNGASLLRKLTVSSARDCYEECCNSENCNVAVMHYKDEYTENGEALMKKYCFLFDCKSPSVCSYDEHSRYAIIHVPKTYGPFSLTSEKTATPSIPTTAEPLEAHEEEKCPPGVPVAMCSDDPCHLKVCTSHPNAICKRNYCGGCFAKFYDEAGNKLHCTESLKEKNEETVVVASTDYEETPIDELPQAAAAVGGIKSAGNTKRSTEDPYFQSGRRTWIDGTETGNLHNASLPKKNAPTPKPTATVVDNKIGKEKVIVVNNSFMSIPLLIALCICILLIVGLIYRFRCAGKGKPKKFPVDDGDYLINGMYL